jgi:mannosyltransferase OCH1-like enzyme
MPARYKAYGQKWLDLNPGYELVEWNEEKVEDLGLRNFGVWNYIRDNGGFTCIPHSAVAARATQLADVAAYEIIHHFGGIYVNCDMEPLRPISDIPVLPDAAYACQEVGRWINNGMLGGPAGHPFWELVIDELPERWTRLFGQPMHITTGPHLLTSVYEENPDAGLTVLPQELFNYTPLEQIPVGGGDARFQNRVKKNAVKAGAVAIHWWGHRFAEARTDC